MVYVNPSDLNVTGWSGLLLWTNQVTNDWFGNLVLLAFFLIMMITLLSYKQETDKSFVASSLMTTILAILFRGIGIIGELPLIIGIVMTGIGVILIVKK